MRVIIHQVEQKMRQSTYCVFLSLLGHGQRSVGQLVVFALLWLHCDAVWTRPVLAIYHRPEHPQLVCPVMDHKIARVTCTDMRGKVKNLQQGQHIM